MRGLCTSKIYTMVFCRSFFLIPDERLRNIALLMYTPHYHSLHPLEPYGHTAAAYTKHDCTEPRLKAEWFDPWTVQPVASRYTDWAIPAHVPLLNIHVNKHKVADDLHWLKYRGWSYWRRSGFFMAIDTFLIQLELHTKFRSLTLSHHRPATLSSSIIIKLVWFT
jgi:hypothetical protein